MDISDSVPAGLGPSGSRFWTETHTAYDLDPVDIPTLRQVCHTLDEIDLLAEVVNRDGVMSSGSKGQPIEHPALAGLRAHRRVLDRLLIALALPDSAGVKPLTAAQIHGRRAANARWSAHRASLGTA